MNYFYELANLEFKQKREGVFYKAITGQDMQMVYIRLLPGVVTNHNHVNEQMGYIFSGKVELTVGQEKKICSGGDAYHIPSDIQHGFKVLGEDPLEYLEMFCPPKVIDE